jgi:MoaA/NifB/PqqE/SkfB family radical SAM enzyme
MESFENLPHLTRVVFSGFGEPLTHPNILEMIGAVRKRDIAVTLGSNGLLLEARMAHELVRLGVDRLVVSVDGVKPETCEHPRRDALSGPEQSTVLNEVKSQLALWLLPGD